ncbi:MAG: transporter substrate-binding domain-containing protein [Kiloniellaceae bacterium]
MIRWLCFLALLTIAAGSVAQARAHDIDLGGRLAEDGKLTVGVALTGRPFAYRRDGRLLGFEIELAAAVARSRGLEVNLVQLPRWRLAAALAAGEVDLVNTFGFKDAVPEGVATVPYMRVGDHMMVLKENPFRIRDTADLAGHTVAATAGTSAEAFAREINQDLIAEGRRPMHIHTFPNQRDTHIPVSMGHAAAYFVQSASALVPTLDPDSRVRLFEGVFRPGREVGFGIRAEDRDLRDAVAHAIAANVANGSYDGLRAKHGIPDDFSPFR